jgi:hypothetical protein
MNPHSPKGYGVTRRRDKPEPNQRLWGSLFQIVTICSLVKKTAPRLSTFSLMNALVPGFVDISFLRLLSMQKVHRF